MVKLLQHGGISGINVNSNDVYRAEKIYGESVYGLKGRMSHRKPNTTTNLEHFQSLVDKNQHLKIDVMKLNTYFYYNCHETSRYYFYNKNSKFIEEKC